MLFYVAQVSWIAESGGSNYVYCVHMIFLPLNENGKMAVVHHTGGGDLVLDFIIIKYVLIL